MKEKDLLDLGYKKYEGETYDVYFNKDVCKHSGNCVKANHTVITAIKGCPSGALKYKLKNSDEIEP